MTATQSILVIDDDPDIGTFVSIVAHGLGFHCIPTTATSEFFEALTPHTALILLDLMMPEVDGIQLLRLLGQQQCKTRIVIMSGLSKRILETTEGLADALGLSIVAYLQKPLRQTVLEDLLRKFVEPPDFVPEPQNANVPITDSELGEAIERNQFVLHYQPQIDIRSREVVGFEALVRWQHPRKGLIFPDSFLPRIEELGLSPRLGLLVANRGLNEMRQFCSLAASCPTLSLNFSASSLLDLGLPEALLSLAEANEVEPSNVVIEVTESGLLKELSRTLDVLIRLRMKRFQISIDDFGTGYAMMQHLRHIPATEIKIDRSFVQKMHSSSSDRVVVEKTIEIGHELGMKVVAEGVETKSHLEFLRVVHCDIAQGYLLSRPLAPPKLAEWLSNYRTDLHL